MEQIASSLLSWYDRCARSLPWRGIHDPYRTWVSEAMLQQTRVETVLAYYDRFLACFPDLPSLAASDEASVLKQWEGLGYYSRARNLWLGAKQVLRDYGGVLPRDPSQLRRISGIGPYTAGAIASIAYGVPVPAVDGNVIRVLARLFAVRENALLPENRKKIEFLAASLVPAERPGDYNQAVMDLGATVCTPGTPDCARCPVSGFCAAFRSGDADILPVLPRAKTPKTVLYWVPVILSGDRFLLRCRTEKLLQGLWTFPLLSPDENVSVQNLVLKKLSLSCSLLGDPLPARHVFTHQVWEMTVFPLQAGPNVSCPPGYVWITASELPSLAVPAAMSAALKVAGVIIH